MSQSDPYASFEPYRQQQPSPGQARTPQQSGWGGPPPRQPKRKHTLRNVLLGIAAGRQFSADDNGGIYLAGDKDGTQLNPGVTITVAVPYQISAGTRIVRLVLHDSELSDGVTVKVG